MTKLALLGEAYGEQEEKEQTPFIGAAGYELTRLLEEAGISRADCFITNVFNRRPRGNKIEDFCGTKAEGIQGYPSLLKGKHIRAEFLPELERLGDELVSTNPNLIVCLGNTACWALLGKTTIKNLRGSVTVSTHTADGFKVLPTYHPAAIFRQYELRPITVLDLTKAAREAEFPEIRIPHWEIWIEPTIEDLHAFDAEYIRSSEILSIDIETSGTVITCIGFTPRRGIALVVPFTDARRVGRSYWPTPSAERQDILFIKSILERSEPKKLFQNGLYDISFILRAWGIKVMGAEEDTMLLHHALQPESLKGLGFLGSVYCDMPAWKQMRTKSKIATIKKDD